MVCIWPKKALTLTTTQYTSSCLGDLMDDVKNGAISKFQYLWIPLAMNLENSKNVWDWLKLSKCHVQWSCLRKVHILVEAAGDSVRVFSFELFQQRLQQISSKIYLLSAIVNQALQILVAGLKVIRIIYAIDRYIGHSNL